MKRQKKPQGGGLGSSSRRIRCKMLQNPKPSAAVAFSHSGSNFCLSFALITIGSLFQKQCCYCMTDMRKKITSIYFEMIQVKK